MKNPLQFVPAKWRGWVYFLLSFAYLAYTAWLAADGDWTQALLQLAGGLGLAMAKTHTPRPPKPQP